LCDTHAIAPVLNINLLRKIVLFVSDVVQVIFPLELKFLVFSQIKESQIFTTSLLQESVSVLNIKVISLIVLAFIFDITMVVLTLHGFQSLVD
jgi:hypothetical protein